MKVVLHRFFVIICCFVLAVGLSGCTFFVDYAPDETHDSGSLTGFSTTDINGRSVTDDIFSKTEVTVVNFWATYCDPCISEMPELASWAKNADGRFQILGVACDVTGTNTTECELAKSIIERTSVEFKNILPSGSLKNYMNNITGVPTTVLVNKNGKIVSDQIIGAQVSKYKSAVEKYLNGK